MGPGSSHDDEPPDESPDETPDDTDDERPGLRPPLPDPLDRVWLHPTELSSLGAAFAPPAGSGPRHQHRSLPWLTPVLAGAAGALLTVTVLVVTGAFDRSASTPSATTTPPTDATTILTSTAAATLARLSPSVVSVLARDAGGVRRGSGVCVRHGAQLLTSASVVGNATSVQVMTSDGVAHTARVAGRDPVTDLVLLDLQDDEDVPAAQLAEHSPATGSPVWLLGAPKPGAKSPWMSTGMASSNDGVVSANPGPTTAGLLETDAASSTDVVGGALVDASGSVAGIVLGHVNGSATTYAVSINVAVGIAEELDATGVARHGTLGVAGVDTKYGPMIVQMPVDGAAARAGVRVSDLVESVDGRAVASIGEVTALVQSLDPGQMVVMGLRRGTTALEVSVRLGATQG
jgi:S1-C subfamily serine protease